ncbi:MAG TPA: hypothetical protein VFP21_08165 [Solirubrobacterales bacterium]|nr:hypothetical protein [Solirubrobacterales bacterium]
MDGARHGLSHNLAREWVSDCLIELRQVRHAEVESEWISEGVAWPEGAVPPDHVHVYVTVPYGFDDGMVGHLADFLAEAAERDPDSDIALLPRICRILIPVRLSEWTAATWAREPGG